VSTNPFPGLRPFRDDEEHLFFGRELQVDAMVDKLAATRFLAVVGVSGSGKSSLVNCGLRPALHRGLMTGAGSRWRVAQFRPGSAPVRALAESLAAAGLVPPGAEKGPFSETDVVETTLRLSHAGLRDAYEQAKLPDGTNMLVVADQFEELFRYRGLATARPGTAAGEDAAAFVNLLLDVREHADVPIYVVITMRSDFLGDCAQFFGLPEAINASQYLVPRLTRDERRLAITGPIAVGGASITPVLLTRLVNDVGENPDQLSILQHALNRTWAHWEARGRREQAIELEHYEAIGTMSRALDQHAEEAYSALVGDRLPEVCEKMFKTLTDRSTDPRGIRRPTRMDALTAITGASAEEILKVAAVFRDPGCAFLMPPVGETIRPDTVIDISHESLMRAWMRLRGWAAEEARSAQMYRRLAESAELHAEGKSGLWRDPDLQLALDWQARTKPNRAWADQSRPGFEEAERFLEASRAERDAERRRAAHKRQVMAALALLVIGALAVALFLTVRQVQLTGSLETERRLRREAEEARAAATEALEQARRAEKVTSERTVDLLKQFGVSQETVKRAGTDSQLVRQSLIANQQLQQAAPAGDRDRRRGITVEYFPKNVDGNKVEAALMELGFTVRKPPAIVRELPTNAMWFGTPVSAEDVKLVAMTLIRAGVEIKAISCIQPYLVGKRDAPLIQVGADSAIVSWPPLKVETIVATKEFDPDCRRRHGATGG
jgi:hypothetical protein